MKIPKQISPDRITDAIVEVKYTSDVPFEVVIGLFYQSFDDTYTYTNRPLKNPKHPLINSNSQQQEIKLLIGRQSIFYNKNIKVEFQPNSIIFNCLDQYILWENYLPEIEKVLNQISKAKVISQYTRIGLRYISEYPNCDLKDLVNFNFSFGMPNVKSDTFTFHTEFKEDNLRVILNLNSKLPMFNGGNSNNQNMTTAVSTIDIDVIIENFKINEIDELLTQIKLAHDKEKQLFFTLLKEEFLSTLNPIY